MWARGCRAASVAAPRCRYSARGGAHAPLASIRTLKVDSLSSNSSLEGFWNCNSFPPSEVDVVIALGSNLGDRQRNFHTALSQMQQLGILVTRHSCLYESAPAYVTAQPPFLNAAVEARTSLSPATLLSALKALEGRLGRDLSPSAVRFGPRPLDLDIIFYGDRSVNSASPDLVIPHPRLAERPFVVAPLMDLLPPGLSRSEAASGGGAALGNSSGGGEGGRSSHWSRHIGLPGGLARVWASLGGPQAVDGRDLRRCSPLEAAAAALREGGPEAAQEGAAPREEAQAAGAAGGGTGALPEEAAALLQGQRQGGATAAALASSSAAPKGSTTFAASDSLSADVQPLGPASGVLLAAACEADRSAGAPAGQPVPSSSPPLPSTPPAADGTSGSNSSPPLRRRPSRPIAVMGVLNVTPDSFSDGGRFASVAAAVARAEQMAAEGADIIDVGGQSTRPGAQRVAEEEELRRVLPVVQAMRGRAALRGVAISVDTFYASVAHACVSHGAAIVNDVSGGRLDPAMLPTVARLGVPFVLMHMRGNPTSMQSKENLEYDDVVADVAAELAEQAGRAEAAGVAAWNIVFDPGLGFSKTTGHNLELLRGLRRLRRELGRHRAAYEHQPLLVGPSRKGFLGRITGRPAGEERDWATAAAVAACVQGRAQAVRVHNVAMGRDVADVAAHVWL